MSESVSQQERLQAIAVSKILTPNAPLAVPINPPTEPISQIWNWVRDFYICSLKTVFLWLFLKCLVWSSTITSLLNTNWIYEGHGETLSYVCWQETRYLLKNNYKIKTTKVIILKLQLHCNMTCLQYITKLKELCSTKTTTFTFKLTCSWNCNQNICLVHFIVELFFATQSIYLSMHPS